MVSLNPPRVGGLYNGPGYVCLLHSLSFVIGIGLRTANRITMMEGGSSWRSRSRYASGYAHVCCMCLPPVHVICVPASSL